MSDATKAGLKRFAKGFIAGGLAQVAIIIGAGLQIHNLEDIKAVAFILATGFITGGILAIEKLLNYNP